MYHLKKKIKVMLLYKQLKNKLDISYNAQKKKKIHDNKLPEINYYLREKEGKGRKKGKERER